MPTYNPQTCFNNLLKEQCQGAPCHPCPEILDCRFNDGCLSIHCQSISNSLHSVCVDKDLYAPLGWNEVYNTNECGPLEYYDCSNTSGSCTPNIAKCQPHIFTSYPAMVNWIKQQPNCSDYGHPGSQCNWAIRPCNCCCACYAYGTLIQTPGGYKEVQEIFQGDRVSAASMAIVEGSVELSWLAADVHFSDGTPPPPKNWKHYPSLVYVHYTTIPIVHSESFVSNDITEAKSKQIYALLTNPTLGLVDTNGQVRKGLVKKIDISDLASMLQLDDTRTTQVKQTLLDAGNAELICTLDELFLLANGNFKQASQLTLRDTLVAPNGQNVPINAIKLAEYSGGIHHIATTLKFDGNPNGHLLHSNGVVTGDYTLQIHAPGLGSRLETGPTIGSEAYQAENEEYTIANHAYQSPEFVEMIALPDSLRLHGDSQYIPDDANSFITQAQGIDILSQAPIAPFSDHAGTSQLMDLFKYYQAYYPDIEFYLDWNNPLPTAYAFYMYGRQHVIISGGLVRVENFYWQGMALVIAQSVAAFYSPDGKPAPRGTLLPRAEADYYGVKIIMRIVWPFSSNEVTKQGIEQLQQFFSYITPQNAQGDPNHPKEDPSIDCRLTTMNDALYGSPLPPCAGGPPVHIPLMVTYATPGATPATVVVAFNEDVDVAQAQDISNYELRPSATITAAKMVQGNGKQVLITAAMEAGTQYMIVADNITATDGAQLDPTNRYAWFTTPQ